jgi:light-regulated signal transduction histidine kinase (bacteriophytochrome)
MHHLPAAGRPAPARGPLGVGLTGYGRDEACNGRDLWPDQRAAAPVAPQHRGQRPLIKQLAQKKNIDVELKIDPAITTLNVDARRLKQILVNLLSNTVKFTAEGGSIGLDVQGNLARLVVEFTVWDTGIEIAPEQLSHLFQPFSRSTAGSRASTKALAWAWRR